jgi:hypothetical protein
MPAKPHYREKGEGASEWRIGDVWIPSTAYIPEVRKSEGVYSTGRYSHVLDDGNPVMVPSHNWDAIKDGENSQATKIEREHPILFYDPPELLADSHYRKLREYSLEGEGADGDYFEELLSAGRFGEALNLFPKFHQYFIKANLGYIYDGEADEIPDDMLIEDTSESWSRVSQDEEAIEDYFESLTTSAESTRNAVFLAPVPRLTRDSGSDDLETMIKMNKKMREVCQSGVDRELQSGLDESSGGMAGDGGFPGIGTVFHIYASESILERTGDDMGEKLMGKLYSVDWSQYSGIAVTIKNPSQFWEGELTRVQRLGTFVENLTQKAHQAELPVISPRFRWFGAFLTDLGVDAYSSLLNGKNEYSPKFGGTDWSKEERLANQYGATNILEEARDLSVRPTDDDNEGLRDYLEENDGLPELEGLEDLDKPPDYNPNGDTVRERFGVAYKFRKEFRNPWELSHAIKARELRRQQQRGVANPGEEYLHSSKTRYNYEE